MPSSSDERTHSMMAQSAVNKHQHPINLHKMSIMF